MDNQQTPPPYLTPPVKKRTISLNYIIEAFINSFNRFPLTLFYLAAFIIWGQIEIWFAHDYISSSASQFVQNIEPALWYLTVDGMLLTLAVYLWCEQSSHKSLTLKCQCAANILLALDFVNILFNYNTFSSSVWVARIAIETALVVSIMFVPSFGKGSLHRNLMFSFNQFGNILSTALIAIVMSIAIFIIFSTVNLLFGHVDYKFSLCLDLIFALGLSILIFLGRIPTFDETEKLTATYTPSKFISGLIRYILLPLTAIYTIILYVYGLKIIFVGTLPNGEICGMVTALTAAVYLLMFLLKAIQNDEKASDKFTRLALRIFPAALFPLLVMMSVAIGERIDQYGMTVARLYVLTFNIWAYITAIYLFITGSKNTNIVALSFAVIFLLSSIIPGLNYTSMINNYMRSKIISALENVGFDSSQFPLNHKQFEEAKEKMDENSWSDIKSKLRYLDDNHSSTEDIADFKIKTGYYSYDPLFDDEPVEVRVINTVKLQFGPASDTVEIPEGYNKVKYLARYNYPLRVDSMHIVECEFADGLKISLNIDSIKVLNPDSINTPIKYIIDQKSDSLYIVNEIAYSIDDNEFNRKNAINDITVRGYLFTR